MRIFSYTWRIMIQQGHPDLMLHGVFDNYTYLSTDQNDPDNDVDRGKVLYLRTSFLKV